MKFKSLFTVKKIFLTLLVLASIAGATEVYWRYRYSSSHTPARMYNFFGKIYFVGAIISGDANRVKDEFSNAWIKPSTFVANSVGGDVYEGIKLGLFIYKNKLDVAVYDRCISSCANYILPAGKNKYITGQTVLGWHGSPNSDEDKYYHITDDQNIVDGEMVETSKTYTTKSLPKNERNLVNLVINKKLKQLDTDFYKTIGVSKLLPLCGQKQNAQGIRLDELNSPNGIPIGYTDSYKYQYYFYSIADLEKFGLTNLQLDGNEKSWQHYQDNNRNALAKYCEID